ncbi:MAG: hypothetical protein Q7V05_13310 [Methanoregula sp.]|nr:hypothetical protein [Methanoregula sp.]
MKDDTILPIISTVALSIGIALFAYFVLIHFMVDANPQYDPPYSRMNNLLNFYEQNHTSDIFILGSSYVMEGIDANVVEELMQKKKANGSVYNLGTYADAPQNRVGEIDYIIASRPKIVVIGLSYRDFGDDITFLNRTTFPNYAILPYLKKKIYIEDFQPFFSDKQLKLIKQTQFEYDFNRFINKRIYIYKNVDERIQNFFSGNQSSVANKTSRFQDIYMTNFKDPWFYGYNQTEAAKSEAALVFGKNPIIISENLNQNKMALLYMVGKARQNNIRVIIINMPINNLMSEKINKSSRHNLSNFLNFTGVPWYNYEREYPSEYFVDLDHLNAAGRIDFSQKVATIIADNLIHGV